MKKSLAVFILCLVISFNSYGVTEDWDRVKSVSDKVCQGCDGDIEKVLTLSEYVYKTIKPDVSKGITAKMVMSVADRLDAGVGWCNHSVGVFMALAAMQGIRTRMLYLMDRDGETSPHTIAEVYIESVWYIVDPANNFNVLVTRGEVRDTPDLLWEQLKKVKDEYGYKTKEEWDRFMECYWNPAILVYELP